MWLELIWWICKGLQGGTNYYTLPFFIPLPHFQYREDIYAHPCFQAFPKQFTDDYLSNHLYGQEARKVFIQHPRFNIEVFLKRTKDGRQSSTGTGLKLQRPSTWMKAQYSPSASAVFQMRCICLYTVYDANFKRFYMLHVKLGVGAEAISCCTLMYFNYEILLP